MRLRIILRNSGFLTMEMILAFSLFTLFTISVFTLNTSLFKMRQWSSDELIKLKNSVKTLDDYIKSGSTSLSTSLNATTTPYGNEGRIISIEPFDYLSVDLVNAYGRNTCSPRIELDLTKINYFANGIMLGVGNNSTDIEVRNDIVYLSTDSNIQSQPDLFIIDNSDPSAPSIISSINTGPGISALEVAGPYVYIANTSTNSQLQIIDIHNRQLPRVIAQLKLPLPEASTTSSHAKSVFYRNGYVYLGTEKWDGAEFYIIDVKNMASPQIVGSFETSTLINDIYVKDSMAYLATSDIAQMRVLDISSINNPVSLYTFSPSGWQTQEGRVLDYFENRLSLGRTVGGFNNILNHEIFAFSTSSYSNYISHDIPGGVYDIVSQPTFNIFITHSISHEFQIWDSTLSSIIFNKELGIVPIRMACDWSKIYFVTGSQNGFTTMTL